MQGRQELYESVANSAAYPFSFEYENNIGELGIPATSRRTAFGITRREYFTAAAIQGLLAGNTLELLGSAGMFDALVSYATTIADKAIEQLYPQPIMNEDENRKR